MGKRTVYSVILIVGIVLLIGQYGERETESVSDERVVARFVDPSRDTVRQFRSPEYDVVKYEPGAYLDIVLRQSEFESLQLEGFELEIVETEATYIRDVIRKAESAP